ncbi:MAG: 50S ribosomal protein L23 [Spirochaetes bacterium]|nr:50S ribosomal protein L23 [Spirochaetota bacterium]MCK5266948.1 50S ribosomal protein L23 [Spirochaetota bacterium]
MKKAVLQNIIISPLLTEKANTLKEADKYVFKVDRRANKDLIKRALESMYEINVLKCNIINVRGKKKRVRYRLGMTPSWKKAIVTIKQGQTFPFFEGI